MSITSNLFKSQKYIELYMYMSYDYVTVLKDVEVITMAYGEVERKATNKYRSKYAMLQVRVEPKEKDMISKHAEEHGESVNAFINRAIRETIERDNNR